jgi:hypothetical protein
VSTTPHQSIIVCPDCGQRYDPAKAARIERVRTRDGRTIKPGRVEAQDVNTAAHRGGRHHLAHRLVTHRSLSGWVILTRRLSILADKHRMPVEAVGIDPPTWLSFLQVPEFEDVITLIDDDAAERATCERILRAARAVREDHPWWRAYLHELGMGADEIARGFTVSHDNRADVLFERRAGVFALDASGPTLRGLL